MFDGLSLLYTTTIPNGRITHGRLETLLRMLVAKHALDEDDIVQCHLTRLPRRSTSEPHPPCPLDVRWSTSGVFVGTCGENPHAVATALNKEGRPVVLSQVAGADWNLSKTSD